jgi:hypothetical protein
VATGEEENATLHRGLHVPLNVTSFESKMCQRHTALPRTALSGSM